MFRKRPYRTARAVLQFQDRFLLAVHASFRAHKVQRWGLPGGGIEWGESPQQAVQRELREELSLQPHEFRQFQEIGAFGYKGSNHMVYGAHTSYAVSAYDDKELLALRWFDLAEVAELEQSRQLHAGYELTAIRQFISSTARMPAGVGHEA